MKRLLLIMTIIDLKQFILKDKLVTYIRIFVNLYKQKSIGKFIRSMR